MVFFIQSRMVGYHEIERPALVTFSMRQRPEFGNKNSEAMRGEKLIDAGQWLGRKRSWYEGPSFLA